MLLKILRNGLTHVQLAISETVICEKGFFNDWVKTRLLLLLLYIKNILLRNKSMKIAYKYSPAFFLWALLGLQISSSKKDSQSIPDLAYQKKIWRKWRSRKTEPGLLSSVSSLLGRYCGFLVPFWILIFYASLEEMSEASY